MVRIVQRPPNRFTATSFLLFFIFWLVFTSSAQNPAGLGSIRSEELRQKLTYLASEKFKGRGNGTPELDMAAEYIASTFEKNGLKPAAPDGSFYQRFNIYSAHLGSNNAL